MSTANERTFQGELYRVINNILSSDGSYGFMKITQEENVGKKGSPRFADGKLYSNQDGRKIVLFELKNTKWDATDDDLVSHAALKALNKGYEYFVTGTPRQLVVFRTFEEGVTLSDRKLKVYTISNVFKDDDVLLPSFEKEIAPKLKVFLKELSDLIHNVKEVHWDSIDRIFVNKLSSYILEASAEMFSIMFEKIKKDKAFRLRLRSYLKSQDVFNLTLDFDSKDVYKICQLSNYLLYLKVIFYSYLQRDVPELHLKPLEIPEDKKHLNKTLRSRFDDVLKHDFEMIFSENIFDEFEFEPKYIPVLKHNVGQIKNLRFEDLNADIIGAIYNTLIDNQEQHDRGQHFTNTNEVDIVNSFCIRHDTNFILDSGCGAGTFLVRGYLFLKHFHKTYSHQQLLERLWGIEIAPFPAFLSTMNLSLLNIRAFDNYPVIINSDFSKIRNGSTYSGIFLNANHVFEIKSLGRKIAEVKLPEFDACVGNPPYIRQEKIEHKDVWSQLAKVNFGIERINQQSDLYVYYLIHTAAFLRDYGRMGYVISSSWLDVSFGAGLQKFILDRFRIIAVIDHQKKRSFETALINTVILILEKCSIHNERQSNDVKFVRIFCDYEKLIGNSGDRERLELLESFRDLIVNTTINTKNQDFQISVVGQKQLEEQSTFNGKYSNGYWGARYLRSPDVFDRIMTRASKDFEPLQNFMEVQYGIKTGANEFFYLIDETEKVRGLGEMEYKLQFGVLKGKHMDSWEIYGWFYSELTSKHYIIEREYVRPVFKSQREAENLSVNKDKLKFYVLFCSEVKTKLIKQGKKVVKYINEGEEYDIHKRASVSSRSLWYDLTNIGYVGDFIFPSKIGERFRLIDNRSAGVLCDKVNYIIKVKDEYREFVDLFFLYLNSTIFRFLVDLFSRQMVVKVSDVDVNLVEKTLIVKPSVLSLFRGKLKSVDQSLRNREQETIYQEVLKQDRIELDTIIFNSINLDIDDVMELHREACKYIRDREEKAESLSLAKSKQKLSYDEIYRIIKDRFPEIRRYKELVKDHQTQNFDVPDGDAKYPKEGVGKENLFGLYNVFFNQGKRQKMLTFDNPKQLELFEFLNRVLETKKMKLEIPRYKDDCQLVLTMIKQDFEEYAKQIQSFLKTNRSSENYVSVYRDVLFS
jgi:type I restriction enzyme M protein